MIDISGVKTIDDLKTFVAYFMEHIGKCETLEDAQLQWVNFRQSLETAAREILNQDGK